MVVQDSPVAGYKPSGEEEKKNVEDPGNEDSEVPSTADQYLKDNVIDENIVYGCVDDPNMPDLEDINIFKDLNEDFFGAEAALNNMESNFQAQDPPFSSSLKDSPVAGYKPSGEEEKKNVEDPGNEDSEVPSTADQELLKRRMQMSTELTILILFVQLIMLPA
nr:hypothetical protein [Tanacetum cinerariifolium]